MELDQTHSAAGFSPPDSSDQSETVKGLGFQDSAGMPRSGQETTGMGARGGFH